jgi:hypothetical protein
VVKIAISALKFNDPRACLLAEGSALRVQRLQQMTSIISGTSWDVTADAIHGLVDKLPAHRADSAHAAIFTEDIALQ